MAKSCVRRCVLVLLSGLFIAATASMGGCGRSLAGEAKPLSQRIPSVSVAWGSQPDGAWEFSANCYMAHVTYLASDELGGRGVGTEGIRQATEYIADTFERLRLTPGGDEGSYFQGFGMKTGAALTKAARLVVDGLDVQPVLKDDFTPFSFSSANAFEGDVVFCGYGIVNPDKQHDDYVHLDVTGKVVLVLRGEPPGWEPEEGHFTENATFQTKVYAARNRDAAALLIVNQKPSEGEEDKLVTFSSRRTASDYGLPAFHVRRALAEQILSAGGLETLDVLQEKLDGDVYRSANLTGVRVSGESGVQWKSAQVRNVIGILPGAGPKADECVVIGAHHDHLGTIAGGEGSSRASAEDGDMIHNGADDNASGVAGVLELAEAFAAGPRPGRSIAFMTFTGEESGLIGSHHYVSHPVFPLEKTRMMVNLDMIGRMAKDKEQVQVFGTKSAEEIEPVLTQMAERVGLSVKTAGGALGGSDQMSFYTKGVPVLHVFSGLHDEYHTPDDDAALINEQGAVRILELVHALAWEFASPQTQLTYSRKAGEGLQRGPRGFKVVLGIMPSYTDSDEPGMEVVAVTRGRPAEAAGLLGGDRILGVDGKTVNNVYDYMGALTGKKPGDVVEVSVKRGEDELTFSVTLVSGK